MKKQLSRKTLSAKFLCCGALLSSCLFVACDDYDLDEKLPPEFGSTVYSYLQSNDYSDFTRLVQDLGYQDALSGRSIKTLFVANDDAFAKFYANNKWGVKRYEDLSLAQKKILLYSSMIDNSLQIMNLSSTTGSNGPIEGNCMRRVTASSVYDTVSMITPEEMPDNNKYWSYYRDNNKPIVCMKDMTTSPIMFFVEKFLTANKITNSDIDFLFNNESHRQAGDAGINGIMVAEPNIRCANGFLHRLESVLTPLDNMAEIIRTKPQTSIYSRMIERYSAPYYIGRDNTNNYNYEYGTDLDSVFQKRYFANRSIDGNELIYAPDGITPVDAALKFDPGWNGFFSDDPNTSSSMVSMQKNMAVMLVPSDEALNDYWNNGSGKVLKDYYGSWDNVPDAVLAKLINNNMLNSFVASVPSKFEGIVNSTQDAMGIKVGDVDSVFLACNGAIYLTNKVFSPTEYVSVSFPALINETMNILYWAIEQNEYEPYLNSLDSYYSLFIPTNKGLLSYVDPVSYGMTKTRLMQFHYKADAASEAERVWASIYEYDTETGVIGDSIGEMRYAGDLNNRLVDILDNHIVVGNIESGKTYYRTKNGNVVKVQGAGSSITGVMGSLQMDANRVIPIATVYDESKEGNGKTYIIDDEPIMTTNHSVLDILSDHEEFSVFKELLAGSDLIELSRNGYSTGSVNGNITEFNNYHYTVYVPSNESLTELINSGDLPTWDKIDMYESDPNIPEEYIDSLKNLINDFLRYHIQDNSIYIGMDYNLSGSETSLSRNYETAIMNEVCNKFYTINATVSDSGLKLIDELGNTRNVVTSNESLYNLPAREYQLNTASIGSSAFAVVHLIDAPLFYSKKQCPHYSK